MNDVLNKQALEKIQLYFVRVLEQIGLDLVGEAVGVWECTGSETTPPSAPLRRRGSIARTWFVDSLYG